MVECLYSLIILHLSAKMCKFLVWCYPLTNKILKYKCILSTIKTIKFDCKFTVNQPLGMKGVLKIFINEYQCLYVLDETIDPYSVLLSSGKKIHYDIFTFNKITI